MHHMPTHDPNGRPTDFNDQLTAIVAEKAVSVEAPVHATGIPKPEPSCSSVCCAIHSLRFEKFQVTCSNPP